ncbi:hypothetical protein B2J93_5582 [Marssonina coronariae]|uniref:Uncharacterized protein n=1 Tax=Diplocarpon coronariae TaxID=2795749 RepID=A0A218Z0L8_9HELO|nr:hypothetical protein B2J93_5582 [Marssonina coronariae]
MLFSHFTRDKTDPSDSLAERLELRRRMGRWGASGQDGWPSAWTGPSRPPCRVPGVSELGAGDKIGSSLTTTRSISTVSAMLSAPTAVVRRPAYRIGQAARDLDLAALYGAPPQTADGRPHTGPPGGRQGAYPGRRSRLKLRLAPPLCAPYRVPDVRAPQLSLITTGRGDERSGQPGSSRAPLDTHAGPAACPSGERATTSTRAAPGIVTEEDGNAGAGREQSTVS